MDQPPEAIAATVATDEESLIVGTAWLTANVVQEHEIDGRQDLQVSESPTQLEREVQQVQSEPR